MKIIKNISTLIFTFTLFLNVSGQVYETELSLAEFPDYGISLSIPGNWNYTEGSKNIKTKLFTSHYKEPDNKTPYNTVSFSLSYNKIEASPDSIFRLIKQSLESQVINNQLTEYSINTIRGRPTKAYRYNFEINGLLVSCINVYFIENNTLFTFSSTIFKEKLEKYEPLINKIIASISLHESDKSAFKNNQEYKKLQSKYINDKYGFEINFPMGWYYIEDLMSNAVLVKKAEQDTDEFIAMGIDVYDETEILLSSKEFNQAYLRKIQEQMLIAKDSKESKPSKFKHAVYETYKSSYLSSFNNIKLMVFVYSVIKDKKGYVFMSATDIQHLKRNEKLFDKTFESLELK